MIIELMRLFAIFFKIGLFTFGGGYAMIPMITQDMLMYDYLTSEQITTFIGIAESTPGPFAINIATFAGFESFGFIGAFASTLGVVLPSFIIIFLIASLGSVLLKKPIIKNGLDYLKPVVVALVFTAAINIFIQVLFMTDDTVNFGEIDYSALIIFTITLGSAIVFKRKLKPVHLVLISAILGIIIYAL